MRAAWMATRVAAVVLLWNAGCGPAGPEAPAGRAPARDLHSFARPEEASVVHMELDWNVSFEERVLEGTVVLHLDRREDPSARELRLDTRDLDVRSVEAGGGDEAGFTPAVWRLGDEEPHLGRPLVVELPAGADRVRIAYGTSPDASGLQWLGPEQTAGGHPFLYSQSQAIHARSWIPCQDSPAVRTTFDAQVRVPRPLRAVMGARDETDPAERVGGRPVYRFTMEQPIPSYLLALAVGELEFRAVGSRAGVWAEPPVVERAAWEFADTERMMEAAERLYGPYRWERYDILVLPPAFPFGGMENPRLTFATPTILAGDRSLVSLVAHELAHSWSGNLVTNATWSDFWLNEGFTTYIQGRLQEALYGRERAEMEAMLGRQELELELAEDLADKPGDQVLHVDLAGRDPDDGFTNVPYEKGSLLLRLLEETFGREVFDPFLRSWFDRHAFTSVTTEDFLAFLDENLLASARPLPGRTVPDIRTWVEGPGLPSDAPRPESQELALVDRAVERWASGGVRAPDLATDGWTTQHWLHFLRALPDELTGAQMARLDGAFRFTGSGNSEILAQWVILAVRHGYDAADARMEEFLKGQGRRKFLKPIYQELAKTPAGLERARSIYREARPRYHSISQRTLDEILEP